MTATLLKESKARLRRIMRQRRASAAAGGSVVPGQVSRQLLTALPLSADATVSGYWPMREEVDPRPLLEELHRRGHRLCLPVVVDRAQPLAFRQWQPGNPLCEAAYGTLVPAPGSPGLRPDVLLVPLLAFDRQGYRLGYGGGFYDRTLTALRADGGTTLAVGIAYAMQELAAVPHDENDQRLDWIVTERAAYRIS